MISLYSESKNYKLYHGDMLDMLDAIEPNSIDSIVTDPPYEIGFMNKGWDKSGIAFQKETWQKCFEVLKLGGHLLCFGGSRTSHRIACAIEDAGFEIRDTIMWLYGEGFPKSMNIAKAIDKREGILQETTSTLFNNPGGKRDLSKRSDYGYVYEPTAKEAVKWQGWGTQLKPAFEPIIVARKPFKGSCVDNVLEYGVGGINIDECRVPFENTPNPATNPLYRLQNGYKTTASCGDGDSRVNFATSKNETSPLGRFPANVVLTYDETDFDEVCGGMPNTSSGIRKPSGGTILNPESGWNNNSMTDRTVRGFDDSGSAARYFYTAKASTKDRDEGLEHIKNVHPTVKPTDLMQYLVRLVTPNGGTILDPFNGSGSTGKAVMYENAEKGKQYKYIGIEITDEYLSVSKARIEYAESKTKFKKVSFDDLLE